MGPINSTRFFWTAVSQSQGRIFFHNERFSQRLKDKKEQTNDQGKPLYSEQDKVLADRMVRYWTNFAKEPK